MTTPSERIRAITNAERFLVDLAHGKYPRTPKAVKDEARARLRHYPTAFDVVEMVRGNDQAHSRTAGASSGAPCSAQRAGGDE